MQLFLVQRIQHHRILTLCNPETYTKLLGISNYNTAFYNLSIHQQENKKQPPLSTKTM